MPDLQGETESGRGPGDESRDIRSASEVTATRRACLFDRDPDQVWQRGRNLVPDPDSQHFGRGVLQPLDFVKEVVIEPREDRIDDAFQIREVDQPACAGINRAANGHLASKRVPMHPPALVSFRHIRQIMGSLESEVLNQFNNVCIHS